MLCALPCAAQNAQPVMPLIADPAAIPPADNDAGATPAPDKPPIRSLFFSTAETNEIRLAINSYVKNTTGHEGDLTIDEEDFLNQLTGLKKARDNETTHVAKFYTYPQFFLESIAYHTPDDWAVWINNRRFTPKTVNDPENIRITAIDKNQVEIEWKPLAMSKVNEVWQRGPVPGVEVDEKYGTVVFSLRTNQTFTSYAMRTVEGKVPPVTETNAPTIVMLEPHPKTDTVDASKKPVAKDAEKPAQGLGGLIDQYHKMGDDQP